jgi:hypothetical protein
VRAARISGAHISASENRLQSVHSQSSLLANEGNATRKVFVVAKWRLRAISISHLVAQLDKFRAVFRSFRAHIEIQFAKEGERVPVGPAYRYLAGHLIPDEQTSARAASIETLLATHSWVDSADLKIFLLGFCAGEIFGTASLESRTPESRCNPTSELES